MRIFYASGDKPNDSLTHSLIWRTNLYFSLLDLGHDVVDFKYDIEPLAANADFTQSAHKRFIEKHRPEAERELLCQIEKAHHQKPIHLFFSYFYSSCARPEVIRHIHNMGITTVNWYCNASYQFHLVKDIAPAYDFCLVPEKFRLKDYKQIGANPIYCQEAANPTFYKPYPLPQVFDVTFVGARYGERAEYISYLIDKGIKACAWGPHWRQEQANHPKSTSSSSLVARLLRLGTQDGRQAAWRKAQRYLGVVPPTEKPIFLPPEVCGSTLSDEEMVKMYSRSKISLGFSTCGETHRKRIPISQIRLRDFEAPMSGAFYMVKYMPELEEFFTIGKEIICYHNKADLADKAKYYLTHDIEREEIRQAGYQRAIREHTWQVRFERAFKQMGLTT